jgi:hypothetical protein
MGPRQSDPLLGAGPIEVHVMTPHVRSCLVSFALLAAATGCGGTPSPPAPANGMKSDAAATRRYWEGLQTVVRRTEAAADQMAQETTAAGMGALLRKAAVVCREAAHDVHALPVIAVDPDVAAFASEQVEGLGQAAALLDDLANWAEEVKYFSDRANSFGAGFEAFVCGLLGDPLSPVRNFDAQRTQLEERRLSLAARLRQREERAARREAEELRLRSVLSQRYGAEFPKLGLDRPERERTFAVQELESVRRKLTQNGGIVGELLLRGTHPTGRSGSASVPAVSPSADGRDIRVSVTCFWKGGVTGAPYQTAFAFTINKQSGLAGLTVTGDTAVIGIEPQNLRGTEEALRQFYRSLP